MVAPGAAAEDVYGLPAAHHKSATWCLTMQHGGAGQCGWRNHDQELVGCLKRVLVMHHVGAASCALHCTLCIAPGPWLGHM